MAISDTIRKGILSFKTSENEYTKFLPKTLANLVTTTSGTDVESKINELDDNIGDLDTITETDEDEIITKTYTTGFLSKLIDDVRTTVFNVTHAKAVWWNKLENKTVYDKIDGDCLQYENVVSDLDDMSAITEENAGKFVADARAVAELNSNIGHVGQCLINGGSTPAIYGAAVTVATINITDPGTYIILGFIDLDANINAIMNVQLESNITPVNCMLPNVRTTGGGGGGACAVGYIITDKPCEINLLSYGYNSSSYTLRGSIVAMRLS